MIWRPRSLKLRLIGRLAVAQAILLLVLVGLNTGIVSFLWLNGYLGPGYGRITMETVTEAISHDGNGRLLMRPTPKLVELRREVEGLWFVIQDDSGQVLREGAVPPAIAPLVPNLGRLNSAELSGSDGAPLGVIENVETDAGHFHIMADVRGHVSLRTVGSVAMSTFGVSLFIVGLMALATIVVTPFVVRRALSGLETIADEAARIDIKRTGITLSSKDIPTEIMPLVNAFNAALARIDQGYERYRVFLADAAHELRTPISIITARVATLRPGLERDRLTEDTNRLGILAGQLLDLGRLDEAKGGFATVDIVPIAERVVTDLAPLAFAAGYEMSFDADAESALITGDETAIERAISNLIQNAIDHGGRSGTISIHVGRHGEVEVSDQGPGIDTEERQEVFAPFHRLDQNSPGAGLGLNLVQRIMHLHSGQVEVSSSTSGGACFRLIFASRPN